MRRRTGSVAVGDLLRVLAIATLAQIAYVSGWLDHSAAAFILLLGFVTETLVVLFGHARVRAQLSA